VDHVEYAMVLVTRWLVVCAMCAAVGFAAGYTWENRARKSEVAQIRADIARREAVAAEESRRQIEAATRAMDAALAEKDRRLLDLDATNRRLRHELRVAATGRPCLSSAARGLLQQSPAFGLKLPKTPGGALAAPPTAAADPGDSTDADIATWILDAAALYQQCRDRLDAMRRWDELTHGDGHRR